MEVVVDAYDASERATGWFAYLENELEFPFTAHCTKRRSISPLMVGDEVEVVSMAPVDECSHENVRHDPLGTRRLGRATFSTRTERGRGRYWVCQGYQF